MMIDNAPHTEAISPRKKELASQRTSRWSRVSHLLNIVAAVLVVAILIGSAALLLNTRKNANLGTTITGARPTKTQPAVTLDCSHIFTDDDYIPDNGEHAVCTQGKETPLQQSDTINNHKLTLISTYADANRLLIKYVESGNTSQSYDGGASISKLTMQNGKQTDTYDPIGTYVSHGGGSYYDPKSKQTFFLESYSIPQDVINAKQLQITATFFAVGGATVDDPAGTSSQTTVFTFTVPMQSAKRVATPNQSLIINGHHLKLTQVYVTPSATYLYVKPEKAINTPPQNTFSATVNGKKAEIFEVDNGQLTGKWEPLKSLSISISENWLDKPTDWTLKFQSTGDPLGVGNGEIQFTVPAA